MVCSHGQISFIITAADYPCMWVSRLTKVKTSILSLISTVSSASFLHSSPVPGYSEGIWPGLLQPSLDLNLTCSFTEHFWYRSGINLSSSVKGLKWLAKICGMILSFTHTPEELAHSLQGHQQPGIPQDHQCVCSRYCYTLLCTESTLTQPLLTAVQ